MTKTYGWLSRRDMIQLLGIGGTALAAGLPDRVFAQSRKNTLVIGLDISDTITLDPARQAQYTPPMTLLAAYDMLVTMAPGDYITIRPALATKWARTPDGKGWRFTLREGVKFASGNPMTAEDVKWSLDRVLYLGDQTAQYIAHVDRTEIVDATTVDVVLKDPSQPLLTILAAPGFVIYDRKLLEQHGGDASIEAKTKDKATTWLNSNSAGAGAYRLVGWERNAQIQFVRNDNYWRGKPPFERVIIRHIGDSAAQLLSIRRGDVDIAFNLIPEQIATVKADANLRLEALTSLDFVYMALTQEAEYNKALAVKEARQAIGYAIDYDGIITNLLGGAAVRPANFLPIGVSGSTEKIARDIGFPQDLAKAKALLQGAGLADGFEFELAYGTAAIAGVTYQTLAQKIQADLARINIRVKLTPMDQVNLRTTYTGNKAQGGVLTFWNPPAVENLLWAAATVERVARRVHWAVPEDVTKLVHAAAGEQDPQKQADLWVAYQKRVVDQANLIILFQPIYQIAVRNTLDKLPLTAAGWQIDMYDTKPKA
ncbi:ABC transporter substrate-binding protein [Bradyrhizobium sp. U87765 SZCCT0131]|uniref:ABC transporter substrate-binding protein n=1 Tax=unclassified Bradyrhizobium TaxID=2631580 RepID=UPI001BA6F9F6|nr:MULTISPECIES: ABC transporter substrate-binding protein [unclassified Bradyrhizobium]MBR1222532.1 ABC transporter substrate-binding protein [Bradyrhizobium sp. U87765 SZCCT0131]MBR1265387.1 ABC transporter substrate-binding protein [Bradyrhizobium sp. U87765 SZCCT0134]MBR1302834.1 ABC transporter substrate-binding protein [Bradyrhizobium sp. U87765 SZCCT0110]MBR1323532.1 ABC transporter substrate-binding protein [Bradyrhizobium sp. U87765 SZCCT0109]MBR1346763.1 ABC transporter substrate-bin